MLKIKDATGKVVGILRDGDDEPEIEVHEPDCPNRRGKMMNCRCKEKQKLKEKEDASSET